MRPSSSGAGEGTASGACCSGARSRDARAACEFALHGERPGATRHVDGVHAPGKTPPAVRKARVAAIELREHTAREVARRGAAERTRGVRHERQGTHQPRRERCRRWRADRGQQRGGEREVIAGAEPYEALDAAFRIAEVGAEPTHGRLVVHFRPTEAALVVTCSLQHARFASGQHDVSIASRDVPDREPPSLERTYLRIQLDSRRGLALEQAAQPEIEGGQLSVERPERTGIRRCAASQPRRPARQPLRGGSGAQQRELRPRVERAERFLQAFGDAVGVERFRGATKALDGAQQRGRERGRQLTLDVRHCPAVQPGQGALAMVRSRAQPERGARGTELHPEVERAGRRREGHGHSLYYCEAVPGACAASTLDSRCRYRTRELACGAVAGMPLSVACVLPFGEPREGFLPDTLLALLCREALEAGHDARLVRVYYDGRDAVADAEIAARLEQWLTERDADVVVLERLFDPEPIRRHVAQRAGRTAVLVTRGDSFEPVEGVRWVIGASPGTVRGGTTRRTPTSEELLDGFAGLLRALVNGGDPLGVPGVAKVEHDALVPGTPATAGGRRRAFRPVVEHDIIALGAAPRVERKTLLGNAGCPFAEDPLQTPHYLGVRLPRAGMPIARLGCAFCCMGGDYQKRPDGEVVESLVEQARWFARHAPDVQELVLNDQHALRYVGPLVRAAARAGIPPRRWLFAARADAFVREHARVRDAIAAAEETGHVVETYLSGFEAFSDRELARYNKGMTVADQLRAVESMRELREQHPRAFAYARARGHSLILWNPWTTPEDLAESVATVRRHGLGDLFHELGRNRLRLYRDLPIYWAADRDGAVLETWEGSDEGSGRRKGYNVETPWRFLDSRTRLAYELARSLRDRLGTETETAQLAASIEFPTHHASGADDPTAVARDLLSDVATLEAALAALGGHRGSGQPPRGASKRAAVVMFAGACNNGCATCSNRDVWQDDGVVALFERVDAARARGDAVMLAGREPTVHPGFTMLVARALGDDARSVGVVTNARRFTYPPFTAAAVAAGLVAASAKLFATEASVADSISRDRGGFEQALNGLHQLRSHGVALEIRAPLHALALATFERHAELAERCSVRTLRVEAALDAIGLDRIGEATAALARLCERCAVLGVALEASPLTAGARAFDWMPLTPAT